MTTDVLYDGLHGVQELSGGLPVANTLLGPSVDELLTRTDGAGARTLFADALGSTLALLDAAGAVQTQYTYGPFGATAVTGAANASATQFTGRENDATGAYYYRARYYSPTLQRFVSGDPLGFAGGDSNLYAYVLGSPTNFTDSSGTVLDTIADPGFVGYDIYKLITGGRYDRSGNLVALGLDVVAAAIPVVTGAGATSRAARTLSRDQTALIEPAKSATRTGVSPQEAEILKDWAREYCVRPVRGPEIHPDRRFNREHIRM